MEFSFDPLSKKPPPKKDRPWGVNFGGGTNSVALVVELVNRGFKPNWVIFADTGNERPATYEAIVRTARWLEARDIEFSVTRWWRQRGDGSERTQQGVKNALEAVARLAPWEKWIPEGGWFETLADYCLRTGYMPSAAYGYGGCSTKFKRQPAERWRAQHGFSDTVYCLGFDAGEERRVNKKKCDRAAEGEQLGEDPWYPLYAWGISRDDCEEIVEESGLGPVPKSACTFCPYTKSPEWYALKRESPSLFRQALKIEANAVAHGNAKSGLRRSQGFLRDLPRALPMAETPAVAEVPERDPTCECFESSSPAPKKRRRKT